MTEALPVVVLISGRGSNLAALVQFQAQIQGRLQDQARGGYQIQAVISNRPDAAGLHHAATVSANAEVVDHRGFESRAAFEAALASRIDHYQPQLVVLAGFMRVLGADLVARYAGRMINIHPSLLPQFRGLNTHERALKAGVKRHGASVHYVTAELDGGPVIAQIELAIEPRDTPETLAARLLPLEHQLLKTVVCEIADGTITYQQGQVRRHGKTLQAPLRIVPGP